MKIGVIGVGRLGICFALLLDRAGHDVMASDIRTNYVAALNRGEIQMGALVRDVSAANDWSQVRVWYPPVNDLGNRAYPVYGFILNEPFQAARDARVTLASL